MTLYILHTYFFNYIIYYIGGFAQLIFILLPVSFANWDEDLINCLMYIGVQGCLAALLFLVIPCFFTLPVVSTWTLGFILGSSLLAALWRVVIKIPLESTAPVMISTITIKDLNFSDFFSIERVNLLSTMDIEEPDCELRYSQLREKIRKVRNAVEDEVLDSEYSA